MNTDDRIDKMMARHGRSKTTWIRCSAIKADDTRCENFATTKIRSSLCGVHRKSLKVRNDRDELEQIRKDSIEYRRKAEKERDEAIQHRDEWHEAYIKANAKREAAAIDREVLERESLRRALAFDACQKERDELRAVVIRVLDECNGSAANCGWDQSFIFNHVIEPLRNQIGVSSHSEENGK